MTDGQGLVYDGRTDGGRMGGRPDGADDGEDRRTEGWQTDGRTGRPTFLIAGRWMATTKWLQGQAHRRRVISDGHASARPGMDRR